MAMHRHNLSDPSVMQRRLRAAEPAGTHMVLEGRRILQAASNDYLGLAQNPDVIAAAQDAAARYGVGAGGSSLISGWTTLHDTLAEQIAAWKGCERAIVTPTGFSANLAAVVAFADTDDAYVVADRRNHASLIDAARIIKAPVRHYHHRDVSRAEVLLARGHEASSRWILTDGVFSMDGTLAPIDALVSIARSHDAHLIVDDAHGSGVLGPAGAGVAAHFGCAQDVAIHIGTFSKAFGAQGGFVAGPAWLIDCIVQMGRAFIYSTALSPVMVGAALAALDIVITDEERRSNRYSNMRVLRAGLIEQGWEVVGDLEAPMLGVLMGSAAEALCLHEILLGHGVWAPAIRPPTVRQSRIRVAPMATHTAEHIDQMLNAFNTARKMVTREAGDSSGVLP